MRSGLCGAVELTMFFDRSGVCGEIGGCFFDGLMKAQRVNIVAMGQ